MRGYIQQLLIPTSEMNTKIFPRWEVHSTIFYPELIYEVRNLPRGVHSTIFHPTLRIARCTLISFMQYYAHHSHFTYAFSMEIRVN